MLRKPFTITLSLLLMLCSFGQVPSPLIFSRITKNDGLASNTTSRVVRDKQGFLWIATLNGLQRYDGKRFRTFRHIPGDTTSMPVNTPNQLFIDSKERLWLLFDKQVGIFNTTRFDFTAIKMSTPVNMIKKIMEVGKEQLILFADSKQFIYDEKKQSFDIAPVLPVSPEGYTIGDMAIDPASGEYLVTGKQGSFFYDPKTKQVITKEQRGHQPALDSFISVKNSRFPFIDKNGTWWMINWVPFTAAAPVLYNYDKKKNKAQKFEKIRAYKVDSYYEIWNIFQQSNGTLWIYGMGLLAYYNPAQNRFININSDRFQQNGIDYTYVSDLYEDREKNVWVCTNEGLYRFNSDAQVFRNIPNIRLNDTIADHHTVSNIIATKGNGIWVSTWGGGVFSYNDQLQPIPNPVTAADPLNKVLHVGSLIQRRNEEIWMGTYTGDIKIYVPSANKTFTVSQSLLQGQTITQLAEDRSGNIWIGSTAGLLVKCENGNWQDTARAFKNVLEEPGDILKLYADKDNRVWVCTSSNGLFEIDAKDNHVIRKFEGNPDKNEGLLNNGAADIIQYNDSTFLVASEGICILNIHTNKFKYLLPGKGLPAEHITNLILDKQKRLWVTCDGGLYRLNIDNGLYISYDAADGITNDVLQVAGANVLPDGRIAVATPADFLVFDPEKTIDKKEVPPVIITGFARGSEDLSVDSIQNLEKLVLSHDNTFVRIDMSTLSFRDQYYMSYMLEGLDKSWKTVYNDEITYQYLPPGTYTLKLRSMDGEGIESKQITTLKIEVKPPFWETWWFYSLIALVVGGIVFWVDHIRIKRKTAILQMRSSIADGLYRDIDAALNSITILSTMAKMKADTEPEKSKEFIKDIHTKSQNMTLAMGDILWSINPENDSMEKFMLRFREYIAALKSQYNVKIDVLIDKKAESLQLKMNMRNNIFALFKSGVTNAVKAGADNCRVHVTYERQNLVYTLEFDTAAIDMKKLNNTRLRKELFDKLDELNAKLDFQEHKSNAVFVLNVPVKGDGI